MARAFRRGQSGFSLIEMMVGVTIFGIVCVGAYRMLAGTQELSAMTRAKNDAERQSLLLLHRISRFYMEKKPGNLIAASAASDFALFNDKSCYKLQDAACLNAKNSITEYSFSLHQDTEGCRVNAPGAGILRDCKGLSVASGMWTVQNGCGCSSINRGRVYTAVTKCQRINTQASPALRALDFRPLSQCSACPPGERPVVVENDYKTHRPASANQWKIYPDGARNLTNGGRTTGQTVGNRQNLIENSLYARAAGIEFCTSMQNGTVMLDVNSFYIVKADDPTTGSTITLKRVKQQTSYPVDILTGNGLRFVPDPSK